MKEEVEETIDRLRRFVQKHRVCYEVWPEYLMVKGKREKVGFELMLSGANDHESGQAVPGCERCRETFDDLRQIAEWIMPDEERDSRYEIAPYDHSFHSSPKRKLRVEVALSIRILHRRGFDQPADACEERCLKEMLTKLTELGAFEGEWRSDRAHSSRSSPLPA
ncbi:MAG: hypothetical protein AB1631_23565 [Acidobacteriota bacterium]